VVVWSNVHARLEREEKRRGGSDSARPPFSTFSRCHDDLTRASLRVVSHNDHAKFIDGESTRETREREQSRAILHPIPSTQQSIHIHHIHPPPTNMAFSDLKQLEEHLATRSYIDE
jgi:hypothetical protein